MPRKGKGSWCRSRCVNLESIREEDVRRYWGEGVAIRGSLQRDVDIREWEMGERDGHTTGKASQVIFRVFLEGLEGGEGISASIVRDVVGVIQGLSAPFL
jgi:hypothetical protein